MVCYLHSLGKSCMPRLKQEKAAAIVKADYFIFF